MYEKLIKRTIWVWECCGERDIKDSNPPREKLCDRCGQWRTYREESAIGPDLTKDKR